MFTVELYAKIRHAVMIDGLSRREAAKRFGVHRNTITKMLSFSVPPGYRRRERPASKKLGPYLAWIDAILEGDSQVHKKQRHTAHGFSSGCGMSKGLLVATRSCAGMWRRRCFGGGRCSCH
jgi:transposase